MKQQLNIPHVLRTISCLALVAWMIGTNSGCTAHNAIATEASAPVATESHVASLRSMNQQIDLDRIRLCSSAWSQYERACRRELTLYRGIPEMKFCQVFASQRWPEQVLPSCDRQAR